MKSGMTAIKISTKAVMAAMQSGGPIDFPAITGRADSACHSGRRAAHQRIDSVAGAAIPPGS